MSDGVRASRGSRFHRIPIAALLALLLVPAGVSGAARPQARPPAPAKPPLSEEARKKQEELKRIKAEAAEKRKLAKDLKGREQGMLGQMRKSDDALRATRNYIERLTQRELSLENDLAATEARLRVAGQELDERRTRLASWVRHSYRQGSTGPVEVLLSAENFGDLLKRGYFLSVVIDSEQNLIEAVRRQKLAVEEQKQSLEERHGEIVAVRNEKLEERSHYEEMKTEQQREVKKIRSQRQSYEAAARELEASAGRLQKFLADFEAQRQKALKEGKKSVVDDELDRTNFGANRGRLPWPTDGEVIGRFGLETHPEFQTQIRNNGIDIQAPDGAPVRAVADGRVEMNDWLPGYGQSIILNHGNGWYTIYAHLGSDNVAVGDRVTAGQSIGTVGDSGSLKGTCLHFELRRGREAQDPGRWLR